jgi:HEAT repeat protein
MLPLPRFALPVVAVLACALSPLPLRAADAETAEEEQILKKAGVASDGPGLLAFFRQRTVSKAEEERIAGLIGKLGSKNFKVRNKATKDLLAAGVPALPALRRALQASDAEVQSRAKRCLETIEKGSPPELPLAAACLLKVRKPDKACPVLLGYLPFADNDEVEEEVLNTLAALAFKGGKADPVLAPALQDKVPVRRAAAGLALGRSTAEAQRKAVRPLLRDADPKVRFYAAQGLLFGKDKSAIPALVALLGEGPLPLAQRAEDLLTQVTDATVSKVELAADKAARKKVHDAWSGWWKANETKLDLARLDLDNQVARTQRARKVVQQCLGAYLKLDKAGFKKTLKFPFYMLGVNPTGKNVLQKPEELDPILQMLDSAPKEVREMLKKMSFKIKSIDRVGEYLKNADEGEKKFLQTFRPKDILVVHLLILMDGKPQMGGENAAMFVKVSGGRAWVVGLGQSRRQKPVKK